MLSGTIDINGSQILEYHAVNQGSISLDNACLYDVVAKGRDGMGYPFEYRFQTVHMPHHGAAALSAVILSQVAQRERDDMVRRRLSH